MDFRIRYEKGYLRPAAHIVQNFLHDGHQLPYYKELALRGTYRQWIENVTEDDLDRYIKENEELLKKGMEVKALSPNFKEYQHLVYRNCLYMVEKHLRHQTDTMQLDSDLENYFAVWKSRYEVAVLDWQKQFPSEFNREIEEVSGVNPFY